MKDKQKHQPGCLEIIVTIWLFFAFLITSPIRWIRNIFSQDKDKQRRGPVRRKK